jgi:hypothetical protein
MLPAGCPGEDPPIRWRWDPLIVARMLREASRGEGRLASGAVAAKRGWRPLRVVRLVVRVHSERAACAFLSFVVNFDKLRGFGVGGSA